MKFEILISGTIVYIKSVKVTVKVKLYFLERTNCFSWKNVIVRYLFWAELLSSPPPFRFHFTVPRHLHMIFSPIWWIKVTPTMIWAFRGKITTWVVVRKSLTTIKNLDNFISWYNKKAEEIEKPKIFQNYSKVKQMVCKIWTFNNCLIIGKCILCNHSTWLKIYIDRLFDQIVMRFWIQ